MFAQVGSRRANPTRILAESDAVVLEAQFTQVNVTQRLEMTPLLELGIAIQVVRALNDPGLDTRLLKSRHQLEGVEGTRGPRDPGLEGVLVLESGGCRREAGVVRHLGVVEDGKEQQNKTEGWDYSLDSGMRVIFMDEFTKISVAAVIDEVHRVIGDGRAYISFDIDVLDPAFAPGTGTPEVGGLTAIEALTLLRGLNPLNLIGADVVEVSPPYDPSGNTALVGATIMYELLCLLAEAVSRG